MLDVVVKAGNLGAARALLEEMKAARLIDAASFNSMLNARGARTPLSVKEVDAVLDEMRQAGVQPTLVSYNAAINAAVELAKEFGGEKSFGFVNAVLDRIWKDDSSIDPSQSGEG